MQFLREIIERKIRYDSTIVEHNCLLLRENDQGVILFHKIIEPFTIIANNFTLEVPKDSYTLAYYWKNKPFNLYLWRNKNGQYLGSYINIVRNTHITNEFVIYEDLIIDLLVLPDGNFYVLDEDELPVLLQLFENGFVFQVLNALIHTLELFLPPILSDSELSYKHEDFSFYLNHRN